jgi:pimeloyl-ACP methyl ester carboxylesterase
MVYLWLVIAPSYANEPAVSTSFNLNALCAEHLTEGVFFETPNEAQRISEATRILEVRLNGLRQYIRVDYPDNKTPKEKVPWIIFAHGRVGPAKAPGWTFNLSADSYYGDLIRIFREAGFAVALPGYRGHGTVRGRPAEGIEFLEAFDNKSHLIPFFYAQDLIAAMYALSREFGTAPFVFSHSQGADASMIALVSLSARAPADHILPLAVSLWSGTLGTRVEQFQFFSRDSESEQKAKEEIIRHIQHGARRTQKIEPSQKSVEAFLEACEPKSRLRSVRSPVQIHYADKDPYSPVAWNRGVQQLLPQNPRHRVHFYPGSDHEFLQTTSSGTLDPSNRYLMMKNTIQFFKEIENDLN